MSGLLDYQHLVEEHAQLKEDYEALHVQFAAATERAEKAKQDCRDTEAESDMRGDLLDEARERAEKVQVLLEGVIRKFQQERDEALAREQALKFYAQHIASCHIWINDPCRCGLSQLLAAAPAKPPEQGYRTARGVVPWKPGMLLPEEVIGRGRGHEPDESQRYPGDPPASVSSQSGTVPGETP